MREAEVCKLRPWGRRRWAEPQSDFAARSVLLSIREVAKTLRGVPGRKTLILFSAGFPLTPDRQSELTATIDALNKANIAVYPVDVRGLRRIPAWIFPARISTQARAPRIPAEFGTARSGISFPHLPGLWAALAAPSRS